jgi:RNA polymerase sigma factor (sigma-70 family)
MTETNRDGVGAPAAGLGTEQSGAAGSAPGAVPKTARAATADSDDPDPWGRAMAAAQQGDERAYRRLLEELLPAIRRQVRAKVSEVAEAEDIVQNALISIHRGRHTYQPERPFGPWMRTIVRHCVIDSFRQRGRRMSREVAVESPELFAAPTEPDDLERGEIAAPLASALQELPAAQREAVELIHLQGLSVAEAALQVGITPGALKVRAHRGYRALRERLKNVPEFQR